MLLSGALVSLPSSCFQAYHFLLVHKSLLSELSLLPSRLSAYETGLPLLPQSANAVSEDTLSLEHIEYCLRIVDGLLLGAANWDPIDADSKEVAQASAVINGEEQEELASKLVTLVMVTNIMLVDHSYDEQYSIGEPCDILYPPSHQRVFFLMA